MKQFLKGLRVLAYPACILIGLAAMPVYGVVSGLVWGKTLQSLPSSDKAHTATLLKKYNLADINFIVKVDGQRVFVSSDLMSFPDRWYRETLLWDESGKVVVLELMGKRVFAYDVQAKRRLEKGELSHYKLFPMPSDHNYAPIKDLDE
jgi:hypothetical protein